MGKKKRALALKGWRRLTAGRVHHRSACWSGDGEWIIFQSGDGDEAAWVLADKKGRVARVFAGLAGGGAAISAIGAVAFGRRAGSGSDIWYTPGGGVPASRLLGGDGRFYADPAWSPDGGTLAFRSAETATGSGRLWLLDLHSGVQKPLPHDWARSDARPRFAPGSGDVLFFVGQTGTLSQIFRLQLMSGAVDMLGPGRAVAPVDEELIVVERSVGGEFDGTRLWAVDARRQLEQELDSDGASAEDPSVTVVDGKPLVALVVWRAGEQPDAPRRREIVVARLRRGGKKDKAVDGDSLADDDAAHDEPDDDDGDDNDAPDDDDEHQSEHA